VVDRRRFDKLSDRLRQAQHGASASSANVPRACRGEFASTGSAQGFDKLSTGLQQVQYPELTAESLTTDN